jgi:hypothetical protein
MPINFLAVTLETIFDSLINPQKAESPTLDDPRVPPEFKPDNWRPYDWAGQENPSDTTQISQPPKTIYLPQVVDIQGIPPLPDRRLPPEADGQTVTATVGKSITVNEALKNKKFGQLLWNPIKEGKQQLRLAFDPSLARKIDQEYKDSLKEYQDWVKAQLDPEYWRSEDYEKSANKFWAGFAFIRPGQLKGHQNTLGVAYGPDWITSVAQSYYLRSVNSYMQVRDFIYKEWEIKQFNVPRKDAKKVLADDLELHSDSGTFYRLGLHRLPAELPEFLFNEGKEEKDDKPVKIADLMSLNEWLIKNLDALFGEFPLKIKYKNLEGKEETLQVDNIAETLAEIIGLSINIATDADTSVAIGFKNLIEATKASNAAIVAGDYARANSEYLGYKGREINREVKLTYTPNKNSIIEALKPSKSNLVGFEIQDNENLQEQIAKLLIVTQIIKSAFYFPYRPGDTLTGDSIREQKEKDKEKADEDWEDLLKELNNPSGVNKIPGNPKPRIRDIKTGDNQNG